ncbi:hypothetical protein [Plastoroseomonas arctica]|uniref:hypothetical protein n=1 Tax=Plastoroseomonas arctica TaxID=1509237 RepID=UPI001BA9EC9C|nr:hypothetical protein [Plastoroseomonas arctica]
MNHRILLALGAPLAFAACASTPPPPPPPVAPVVQAPPAAPEPAAVAREACESAARPMVARQFRGADQITFNDPLARAASPTTTSIRGGGQFTTARGPANFSYRCTFNMRNNTTSAIRITRR